MPRILNGYWCAGVGGGIASVGKLPDVTPRAQWQNAGGSCFLNDRGDVIFQNGAHLERFNVLNGEYQQDFDAQGCFSLAAGGGVYAATFYDGARVSNQGGARYMRYGVGDVSPEGNVILVEPNGTLLGQVFATIQAVEGGGFIALDRNYRPYGGNGAVAPVALPGRIYGLRVHGDLCIYHAEDGGRLIVQRRDSLTGVVLAAGLVECYRPDFEERDGQIVVIYATKEGEAPGQLVCPTPVTRAQFAPLKSASPSPAPVPVPVPKPTPVPQPTPEPVPVIDYLHIITEVRKKYGTPLGENHWKFLVEVAQRTGTQLFKKNGGAHVLIPSINVNVSADIIGRGTLAQQWADILWDSEGEARPIFNIGDGPANGDYLDVAHVVIDGVPPVVTPGPVPPKSLEERMTALEHRMSAIDGK